MKTTTVIGLMLLTLGCNNSSTDNSHETSPNNSSVDTNRLEIKSENSMVFVPTNALWAFKFDSLLNDSKLVKLRSFKKDTLTAKTIEAIVNSTWPKVQIKYLKTSKDTIFIAIPDSEVLTQQMGTTGADEFMISTTYSFTELNGIEYVSYQFEPGDHANPGVYSRTTWDQK